MLTSEHTTHKIEADVAMLAAEIGRVSRERGRERERERERESESGGEEENTRRPRSWTDML